MWMVRHRPRSVRCEGEVEIDNVTVNTVPEAAPLQLVGSAVLVLLARRRTNHS